MRTTRKLLVVPLLLLTLGVPVAAAQWQTEVAAGTRFLVELQTRLDGKRVSPGYEFEARTVEALQLIDGNFIPAGARLTGQVTSVDGDHKMYLRFERIDA